jgi:hypothetical protein
VGLDAMEYGLVAGVSEPGRAISNETNCPAMNRISGGSSNARAIWRTSYVRSRNAVSLAEKDCISPLVGTFTTARRLPGPQDLIIDKISADASSYAGECRVERNVRPCESL